MRSCTRITVLLLFDFRRPPLLVLLLFFDPALGGYISEDEEKAAAAEEEDIEIDYSKVFPKDFEEEKSLLIMVLFCVVLLSDKQSFF